MKLVLYRGSFTDEYVKRIRAEIPVQIRVTETTLPESHQTRSTNFFCILFGSRQTQGLQNVKIKFVQGKPNMSFMLPLTQLKQFLLDALSPSSLVAQHQLSPLQEPRLSQQPQPLSSSLPPSSASESPSLPPL